MEGGRNIERCFDLITEQGFGPERQLFANLLDTDCAYWGNMTSYTRKRSILEIVEVMLRVAKCLIFFLHWIL